MSSHSNDYGRAYEYAWLQSLYSALSKYRPTSIVLNSSYRAYKRAWDTLDAATKQIYRMSAEAGVATLLELEPLMTEDEGDVLRLKLMKDGAGRDGDVRDLIICRRDIQWEIGLSIKHNHEAIKHSRLSSRLDFGEKWYSLPCSDYYWAEATPLFSWLKDLKDEGRKWSELTDKDRDVYIPLLEAFMRELHRAVEYDAGVPQRMVEYLIGTEDYHKVISQDNQRITLIRTFNLHGTLNQPSHSYVSEIHVPVVELPNEIISMRFKPGSTNTVEVYFNAGWQLSFRIHNAATLVEPSLKFDIQFIGMPSTILTIECHWHG